MKTKNTSYRRRSPRSITQDWQKKEVNITIGFPGLHSYGTIAVPPSSKKEKTKQTKNTRKKEETPPSPPHCFYSGITVRTVLISFNSC